MHSDSKLLLLCSTSVYQVQLLPIYLSILIVQVAYIASLRQEFLFSDIQIFVLAHHELESVYFLLLSLNSTNALQLSQPAP